MSSRGRGRGGRGRGRGFGGFDHPAKHVPHENFPDITLPELTCVEASDEENALEFWRTSCYHLEEDAPRKKNEDKQIERFSDRKRKAQAKREALASYLKLSSSNFPAELVQGSRRGQVSNKKLRWDKYSDGNAFEMCEKLEEKHKDGSKVEKGGDEEDEEEEEEEAQEEENSDDDYNQNIEFDDDDDDQNQEEEARIYTICPGLGFKLSPAPFQQWTPDVYEGVWGVVIQLLLNERNPLRIQEREERRRSRKQFIACGSLLIDPGKTFFKKRNPDG